MNRVTASFNHLRRLRNGKRIVGYARIENGQLFYSRDCFWWNGIAVEHSEKDEHCGYRTVDARLIFSDDIVTFEPRRWYERRQYYLVCRDLNGWHLKQLFGSRVLSLSALDNAKQLKVVSHGFLQEDLI